MTSLPLLPAMMCSSLIWPSGAAGGGVVGADGAVAAGFAADALTSAERWLTSTPTIRAVRRTTTAPGSIHRVARRFGAGACGALCDSCEIATGSDAATNVGT